MRRFGNKISVLSIIASIISLVFIAKNNYNLAVIFTSTNEKTHSLFVVVETLNYYVKYYFLIISSVSLILAIWAIRKNESRKIAFTAVGLSILSIILLFIPLWKTMI
jgi:hypothetical protein